MLGQVIHNHSNTSQKVLFPWHNPLISGGGVPFSVPYKHTLVPQKCKCLRGRIIEASVADTRIIKAAVNSANGTSTTVSAVVTVQKTGGILSDILSDTGLTRGKPDVEVYKSLSWGESSLLLELVAAELDPKTGQEKPTVNATAYLDSEDDNVIKYDAQFSVPEGFGDIGAVIVENDNPKEMYLNTIALDGVPSGTINVTCNSWVHKKSDNPENRVFFTNKSYLPSQTPSGVKKLREKELIVLRGDGEGERKKFERIYDYDVYNDLGDPDKSVDLKRPVLGGKEYPYPRRCRTGRPKTKTDTSSESRPGIFRLNYVPRDETFSEVKGKTFALDALLNIVLPSLETIKLNPEQGFDYFTEIDLLFKQGIELKMNIPTALESLLPRLIKYIREIAKHYLRFEEPQLMARDKFAWFRDEEFCRQTLAGINPYSIQLVREWPLKSKLDPKIYGPPESAITKQMIEEEIKEHMTLEQVLEQKRLFMLDYNDLLLPYVNKVRALKGTTLYGSRTLMFLTQDGLLQPLAIELTRPPADGKPQWKEVFRPCLDGTNAWLWKLAKVHVLAHDSGYHQLVSHWLRTHCATEPYIIASNRQLSAMHPIYRLLHPHFRYTMEINGLARLALISAGGGIESSFSPGKYSMELSSVAYDLLWRFDREALPADLISRGMAVEDPTAPHGIKLTIEDYPFANDGLILWDAIKQWVTDYVNYYYPTANLVESDTELQSWWTEIRTVGHGDKKDEPWWPELNTPNDLVGILTTIIWVTAGHHSAVNFGQYDFAGYFPNRPTIARTNMPCEDPSDKEWDNFINSPEATILSCFPSQIQAIKVMGILDVLSTHASDEEYIGGGKDGTGIEPSWGENQHIKLAFDIFHGRIKLLEAIINARNADSNLKNRTGAGVVSYQLLKPYSKPGVTAMGVPNSISI